MKPPLSEIIKGLEEYQTLYGRILRTAKEPKENHKIRRKYDRFKKALTLLKPILGLNRQRGSK